MGITIKQTVRQAVTSTPGTYVNDTGAPERLRVYSDRRVHILVGTPSDVVNVTNGMPVGEDSPEVIQVPAGKAVRFILAAGETDGGIWFTVV